MFNPVSHTELLFIQKWVALLSEEHFQFMLTYLHENGSAMSVKLLRTIRQGLPMFHRHEELCTAVYGSYDRQHRQNFNQLCAHTFRQSGYLAIHYPSYLMCNVVRIQHLTNQGKIAEAVFLAEMLIEVAEKIEDFQTLIACLKYAVQQAYLFKDTNSGIKWNNRLFQTLEYERIVNQLIYISRTVFNITLRNRFASEFEEKKEYVRQFLTHPKAVIRALANYALIYEAYYHNRMDFSNKTTLTYIRELERELHNHAYVIFPYLLDLKTSVGFMKLNSSLTDLNTAEGKKQLNELTRHYSRIRYWKYYPNIPEMFIITIRTTYLLSEYHHYLHRPDYQVILSLSHKRELDELLSRCNTLMNNLPDAKFLTNDRIALRMLYATLLALQGGTSIQRSTEELEALLTQYQQVNLLGSLDSIFAVLMLGYFALKNYAKCNETYKRYIKIIRGRPVFDDNDLDIHTIYYLSQWLSTGRKQYVRKLALNYERACSNPAFYKSKRIMEEYFRQFELPIERKITA
ncbi:MAG: hypothetical protein NZM35_02775 [Chitinophagales bacterium]|nr:hypothetical protein [Chitinophagales bacterium]MDW8418113.1 hypothetical protein [Chitinophagales bacterium]